MHRDGIDNDHIEHELQNLSNALKRSWKIHSLRNVRHRTDDHQRIWNGSQPENARSKTVAQRSLVIPAPELGLMRRSGATQASGLHSISFAVAEQRA
jgi:hypothetical protein